MARGSVVAGGWERQERGWLIHGHRAAFWGDRNVMDVLKAADLHSFKRRTLLCEFYLHQKRKAVRCATLLPESFTFVHDFQLNPILLGETIL